MKQPVNREANPYSGWLLFIYKVPSKPVNKRMKIWRKLIKAGAIQFKGAAYLLPHNAPTGNPPRLAGRLLKPDSVNPVTALLNFRQSRLSKLATFTGTL